MLKSGTSCLTILCALALSGCAHSGSDTGNAPLVRLAYFPNVTHGVALVGTADHAFEKALGSHVKLDEEVFNAGPAEIEALFGGQVDIGYIGPGPAINGFLKSHGRALQIIAGASSGGAALVVRNDSGITDIKGLANKRVAVPQTGGTQDISLRHAMQSAGLSSTDRGGTVTVVPIANASTLSLFRTKQLDAAWAPEPWVSRLVHEGGGHILFDERDLWPHRQFASTILVVRPEFLAEHPEIVHAFLTAHVDTVEWIEKHRTEAVRLIAARLKQLTGAALPESVLSAALSRTDYTYDPLQATILDFASWSKALGYQTDDSVAGLMNLKPLNDVLAQQHKAPVQ